MGVISNKVLYAYDYAAAYTGCYFSYCDTYNECARCCLSRGISISKPITLMDFSQKYDPDKNYVLVCFSTPKDFTDYHYCYMTIQKKYLKRFEKYLDDKSKEI